MKKLIILTLSLAAPLITGCSQKGNDIAIREEQLTVAKVQQEIRIGMPSADVAAVLGSPNMVTTDDQRRETWVYDRVSTNVTSSSSGVWLVVAGNTNSSQSKSQRTLTIIVKFDNKNRVRDFAYRTSTF